MSKYICELCGDEGLEEFEISTCYVCGRKYCDMCESFEVPELCDECEDMANREEENEEVLWDKNLLMP